MSIRRPAARALGATLTATIAWALATTSSAQPGVSVRLRPVDAATVRIVALHGIEPGSDPQGPLALRVSHGSGAAVDPDGWILTARHVVDGADALVVVLPGERVARPARVVHHSEGHDLAIVRVRGPLTATLEPSESPLGSGEEVQASGYPLDPRERWPAAANGEIARPLNDGRMQLSISVNPGNSGGPIVVGERDLVGVVSQGANPQRGAQGLAIMEPLGPILEPLREARADPGEPPPARQLASDVLLEQLDPSSAPELEARVERLREASADDPVAAALLVVEARGLSRRLLADAGAQGAADLPEARRASYDAVQAALARLSATLAGADPQLADRYVIPNAGEFAIGGLAGTAEPPAGGVTGPATGPSPWAPAPTYVEEYPPMFTVAGALSLGLPIDDHANADAVGGGEGGLSLSGRMAVAHYEPFRAKLAVGADLGFGSWRERFAFVGVAHLGARFEIGPEASAGFVEVLYTPGFVMAEAREHGVSEGYRVSVGVELDALELGICWRELGRAADSTLRTLLLTGGFEWP